MWPMTPIYGGRMDGCDGSALIWEEYWQVMVHKEESEIALEEPLRELGCFACRMETWEDYENYLWLSEGL